MVAELKKKVSKKDDDGKPLTEKKYLKAQTDYLEEVSAILEQQTEKVTNDELRDSIRGLGYFNLSQVNF